MNNRRQNTTADEDDTSAWLTTFADLMALLLAFFILLFSFSDVDSNKYKEIASSLSDSMNIIPSQNISLNSPIAAGNLNLNPLGASINSNNTQISANSKGFIDINERLFRTIEKAFEKNQNLQVDQRDEFIVIKIGGDLMFSSGSAEINTLFFPTLDKISELLSDVSGLLIVEGYTDDQPVTGGRYNSNWELSAVRAAAVAESLLFNTKNQDLEVEVRGFADRKPLSDNLTVQGRSQNRRVEILIKPTSSDLLTP